MTEDAHNSSHTRFLNDLATEMEWYADRALFMHYGEEITTQCRLDILDLTCY